MLPAVEGLVRVFYFKEVLTMEGWILLHRQLKEHWIWKSERRLKWWLDILLTVNHTDNKVLIKGKLVECKRGQSIRSLDSWAKDWNVTKGTVRDFFKLLETDQMLTVESLLITTRITVCNYGSYQIPLNGQTTETERRLNGDLTQTKNDKRMNKEINVDFDVFWNLYDKKVGDKNKCKKKWDALKDIERSKIIETVPHFKNQFSDKQYQPFPETYLNQKRWNDEISAYKPKPEWVMP